MDEASERMFLLSNQGILDLTDASPAYLSQMLASSVIPGDHTFATLHRRTKVITDDQRRLMYARGGAAKTVIDDPADYTWMQGFTSTDTDLALTLEKVQRTLRPALPTADRWNRLYGAGLVVMGFNDGRGLSAPLGQAQNLRWAHAFSWRHVERVIYNKDRGSNDYGKPRLFMMRAARPGGDETVTGEVVPVHADRILPLVERPHMHPLRGASALDPAWNPLEDLESIGWSNAEAYYANASPKYVLKTPRPLTAEQEKKIDKQLAEAQANTRDVMKMLSTMELENISGTGDLPDPTPHLITALTQLHLATGIPFSWFFRHHLTSGESIDWMLREFYEFIAVRQRTFGQRVIDHAMDRLLKAGMVDEDDLVHKVVWNPPRIETREDVARLVRNEAVAWASAAKTGFVPVDLIQRFQKAPDGIALPGPTKGPTGERSIQAEEKA